MADDITLLVHTALARLVSLCEEYTEEYYIRSNQVLTFEGKGCVVKSLAIVVTGLELSNVDLVTHGVIRILQMTKQE